MNDRLFGRTPQELQYLLNEQGHDQQWKQANEWGNKNLAQQISTGAFASGAGMISGMGQAAQAAGYLPLDPRVEEAKRLHQVKQGMMEAQIDPSDIDRFYPELIKRLTAGGLIDAAFKAEKEYQSASNTKALVEGRKSKARKERLGGYAILERLSTHLKDSPESALPLAEYEASISELRPNGDLTILSKLQKAIKAKNSKDVKIGTDKDGWPVFQRPDNTTYRLSMVDGVGEDAGKKIPFREDGAFQLKDGGINIDFNNDHEARIKLVGKGRDQFASETQKYTDKLDAIHTTFAMGPDVLEERNSAAFKALENGFATIFRTDSQMSRTELLELTRSGSVFERFRDTILRWARGVPADAKIADYYQAIEAAQAVAEYKSLKIAQQYDEWGKSLKLGDEDRTFITRGLNKENPELFMREFLAKRGAGAQPPQPAPVPAPAAPVAAAVAPQPAAPVPVAAPASGDPFMDEYNRRFGKRQ